MVRQGTPQKGKLGGSPAARERLGLALLIGVALALRVVWLDRLPPNVTADEADNLWVIFRIAETGRPGLFDLDWKPAPAFSMHLLRAFMAVFGETVFGLRMASALLSALALVPFYALARRVVQAPAALAAAGLLATGQWYLHFSRAGWENVHTALYALLAAWALAIALERVRLRWFAVAGAAAALGLYGYFAGRLVLPALLAYAPCALRWAGARWRRVLLGYAVLATTAVLLFLPQVPTIAERWEEFSRRTDAVDVLRQPRPYLGETTDFGVLRVQLQRTLAGFVVLDGELFANGRYGPVGQPPYDPATGALFALGVALGLRRWRATALWWSMLAVPLLATQVLSAETPDAARAVVVAPFVYLFVALALDRLLALAAWRSRGLAQLALLVGVAGLAVVNVRGYFAWIASPAAAEARQPAVELAEYDLWRETLRRDLRAGGFGFNVGQWHATRPAPPSVQPEPPGPRLSPTDGPRRDAYRLAGLLGEGHLRDPRGLSVDPDGTLYVADAEARAVLRFAATGEPLPALGAGLFGEPVGVAVRPGGDLDVLDAETGEVVRLAPDGRLRLRLGGDLGMYRPRGLALAANGDLYVADTGRQRLLLLAPDGRLRRALEGAARFDQPSQVVITADGGLLVAEPQRARVLWLDGQGQVRATWPLQTRDTILGPTLALGPQRSVLVADPDAASVRLVTYDGRPLAEIAGPTVMTAPAGVAVGPAGDLFVADRARRVVLRFAPAQP
ncbi:MAG: NHL repeat-containing protein [Chloroflexi bacterium]|nr:NHL repeat-containing protein [Chloroflexota bacterium]